MSDVRENDEHDDCPRCGTPSEPGDMVADQALRYCPLCHQDWWEDFDRPPSRDKGGSRSKADALPTLERVRERRGLSGLWLVKAGGRVVGMVENYRDTPGERHPWKAFFGTGLSAEYLGAYYADGSVPDDGDVKYGGKRAAVAAIMDRAQGRAM